MSLTALYRMYSGSELLYVGVAVDPGRRLSQHHRTKRWWTSVTNITLEHYPTRWEALDAETSAIRLEHPKHNIVGRVDTDWALLTALCDELLTLDVLADFIVGLGWSLWQPDFTPAEAYNGSDRTRAEFGAPIRERMLTLVGPVAETTVPRLMLPEAAEVAMAHLQETMIQSFEEALA